MMFLGFLLYVQWQKDYPANNVNSEQQPVQQTNKTGSDSDTPALLDDSPITAGDEDIPKPTAPVNNDQTPDIQSAQVSTTDIISTVETPLLKLQFSAQGGALVYAELKQYPLKKNESKNVILMDYRDQPYRAESGLVGDQLNFTHKDIFYTDQGDLTISQVPQNLVLITKKEGATLTKTYTINPQSYAIKVVQQVNNQSGQSIQLSDYQQIKRNNPWVDVSTSFTNPGRYSFKGAGYFDIENGYETLDFDDLQEEKTNNGKAKSKAYRKRSIIIPINLEITIY